MPDSRKNPRPDPDPAGEIIAVFPLPAEWETVERMLNAVWRDGEEWSGACSVSGARWILSVRDGELVVTDKPRSLDA